MAEKTPIVPFDAFDQSNIVADLDELQRHIPQRFEMAQLDGVLFEGSNPIRSVGYKVASSDEFWVRGHMPEFALMPGVIMCESAAQLIAYLASKYDFKDPGRIVGFGGLNNVRFRDMVVPGDTLIVMVVVRRLRKNVMVKCDFQGFVDQNLVVEGEIQGVVLPADVLT